MTYTRAALTVIVTFVVSQILAIVVHGYVLAADYAPFYGTLLRSTEGDAAWQIVFLSVGHLSLISGLIWMYSRLRLAGSQIVRGLKLGVVGWMMGQVPLWLIWYAEQPWPGDLVAKQLGLELLSSLLIGLTIAVVVGSGKSPSVKGVAADV